MPSRKRKSVKRWSMYPSLHNDVSRLLDEEDLNFGFHDVDDASGCAKEYDTNIMGRFICHNSSCKAGGWASRRVAITIRMYPEDKYNARVYHQRCQSCNSLSRPLLDESYAERVAYRIKKWNGIQLAATYSSGNSKLPHNSDLCEGCKDGHCKDGFMK